MFSRPILTLCDAYRHFHDLEMCCDVPTGRKGAKRLCAHVRGMYRHDAKGPMLFGIELSCTNFGSTDVASTVLAPSTNSQQLSCPGFPTQVSLSPRLAAKRQLERAVKKKERISKMI